MKKLWLPVLTGIGLLFAQLSGLAQDYKNHVSKQFNFAHGVVAVYNLEGGIKIIGYAGDKVLLEIDETITGKTTEDIERGKKEFKLGFDEKADSLIMYTAQPYDTRPHKHRYDNDQEKRHYNVKLEYTLKVPNAVNLRVSTVNNGNINVAELAVSLKIYNVNGPIIITNAKGATDAVTIKGGIKANYIVSPPGASSFRTVNGKLDITYPRNFAANLQFKSKTGKFFTDFDDTEILPTQVLATKNKNEGGTQYNFNKYTQVKLGAGGKLFKFETLNGDIYIKKQY